MRQYCGGIALRFPNKEPQFQAYPVPGKTKSHMKTSPKLLDTLGGEAGCNRLSSDFYARVGRDPILRPLFPGKTLRCATEEFAAFLVQFLEGNEENTQSRWWLSLRESHARFQISSAQRGAWLTHMAETLNALPLDESTRVELKDFFGHSSAYVAGHDIAHPATGELAARWNQQLLLDNAIAAIASGHSQDAIDLSSRFVSRPSVMVGLLGRMVQSGNAAMVEFVAATMNRHPSLATHRFAGRTLLHFASAAGCTQVVNLLLRLGADPNVERHGGHTPLYDVANECSSESGPEVVRTLVRAGADVNACGGVMHATPLHMAARRGFVEITKALLDCGASIDARDRKGDTPLQRSINCRKDAVTQLLIERGAARVR